MYERNSWYGVTAQGDEALTRYLIEQGLELNLSSFPVEFRRRLGQYFTQREKDLLETTYTYVLIDLLKDKGYTHLPDEVIRKALDSLFSVTQTNWMLEDDTIPMLKRLEQNGYRMGIISNAGDDNDVQQLISRFEIASYFDFILTSASCSYRKPHPRIFELAIANWYFLPSETVMVGDNLDADIRGAKGAGLYGIWISRRAGPSTDDQPRVQPDATISTLEELPALLDRLQIG